MQMFHVIAVDAFLNGASVADSQSVQSYLLDLSVYRLFYENFITVWALLAGTLCNLIFYTMFTQDEFTFRTLVNGVNRYLKAELAEYDAEQFLSFAYLILLNNQIIFPHSLHMILKDLLVDDKSELLG